MKKYIVMVLIIGGFLYSAPRKVLGEMFTNTSCGPCRQDNLQMDSYTYQKWDDLSFIRYHVWWPSSADPFYQANQDQNRTRTMFYHINAVPAIVMGGTEHMRAGNVSAFVEDRLKVPSPVFFNLYAKYEPYSEQQSDTLGEGKALFHIVTDTTVLDQEKIEGMLHLLVLEDSIHFNAPNGLTLHNQVMRRMFPGATGLFTSIDRGAEYVEERDFYVDTSWIQTMCQLVGFYQATGSPTESYNSDHFYIIPKEGSYDFSIQDVTIAASGNWQVVEPGDTLYIYATVENNGDALLDMELIVKTDPEYQYMVRSFDVGQIKKGGNYTNVDDPLIVCIPEDAEFEDINVTVYAADKYSHLYVSGTGNTRDNLGVALNESVPFKVNVVNKVVKIRGYTGNVVIYDALGRFVKETSIRNNGEIDLSSQTSGIYFVKFLKSPEIVKKIILF